MPEPSNTFNSLAGVPTHYARPPIAAYGTQGKPHTFHATTGLEAALDACFLEIWQTCPYGRADVITSAGAYVSKPGQHGHGSAFDLDALFWPGNEFVTLKYPQNRRFYLGIEAILKKHFGTVLSYNYNSDHHDHLHVDLGSNVGFGEGKSTTALFVGAVLNHVFGRVVKEGPALTTQMRTALTDVLTVNGIPTDLGDRTNYFRWLDLVARTAWSGLVPVPAAPAPPAAAAPAPLTSGEALHSVITLINERLEEHPSRKDIEAAVSHLGSTLLTTPAAPAAPAPQKFTTPKASSTTADKKGASTTSGLSGLKTVTGPSSYIIEAVETVTAKREGKSLGTKVIPHRRTANGTITVVEQADYCWRDRWLPEATLDEKYKEMGSWSHVFSGKATYFGKFDNIDEGTGSPLWSIVQTNSSVFGASLKRKHLLDEQLAEELPGKVLRLTEKGKRAMVEVYYAKTGRMIRVPLVDVGPSPAINAVVDLTVAATAFLQGKLESDNLQNINVDCRLLT